MEFVPWNGQSDSAANGSPALQYLTQVAVLPWKIFYG